MNTTAPRATPYSILRKQYQVRSAIIGLVAVASLISTVWAQDFGRSPEVEIARNGKATLPIVAGSVKSPVEELRHYLNRLVGNEFALAEGPAEGGETASLLGG